MTSFNNYKLFISQKKRIKKKKNCHWQQMALIGNDDNFV